MQSDPRQLKENIRNGLENIENTSILCEHRGYSVVSNQTDCNVRVTTFRTKFCMDIPFEFAESLLEQRVFHGANGPYVKFLHDVAHWHPHTGSDGQRVIRLYRPIRLMSYCMGMRLVDIVQRVFKHDTALEALAAAALELADEFQAACASNH